MIGLAGAAFGAPQTAGNFNPALLNSGAFNPLPLAIRPFNPPVFVPAPFGNSLGVGQPGPFNGIGLGSSMNATALGGPWHGNPSAASHLNTGVGGPAFAPAVPFGGVSAGRALTGQIGSGNATFGGHR